MLEIIRRSIWNLIKVEVLNQKYENSYDLMEGSILFNHYKIDNMVTANKMLKIFIKKYKK